jgi:hypothetical protein
MTLIVSTPSPLIQSVGQSLNQAQAWVLAQPLWNVAFAAAVGLAVWDVAADPTRLLIALGDSDDATRLTQVRQLMAGQGFFDLTLARYGGAEPLISHWSRLIDVPLALLIGFFSLFLSPGNAELATRFLWPTLLLVVLAGLMAVAIDSRWGRRAALITIALVVLLPGRPQFVPGRIDHHSVMIIGAVVGILFMIESLDIPRRGWWAGLLFGVGTAVGLESLVLTLVSLGLACALAIFFARSLAGLARVAIGYAATLAGLYAVTGAHLPAGFVPCDAAAMNLVLLLAGGAAGMALAHNAVVLGNSRLMAFSLAALGAAAGVIAYIATEPACLGGPFAQVPARLNAAWLSSVAETQSVRTVFQSSLLGGVAVTGLLIAGFLYGVLMLRQSATLGEIVYVATFCVAAVFGVWQIKLLPYAMFLVAPLIAIGLTRKEISKPIVATAPAKFSPLMTKVAAVGCGIALVIVALLLEESPWRQSASPSATPAAIAIDKSAGIQGAACTGVPNISPLNALPHGLVASDIDMGPYIVALTSLDVIAAPYHRIGRSILASEDLLLASAAEAPARMARLGASYVVLCPKMQPTDLFDNEPQDSLRRRLMASSPPAGLEPVAIANTSLKVWRLMR